MFDSKINDILYNDLKVKVSNFWGSKCIIYMISLDKINFIN